MLFEITTSLVPEVVIQRAKEFFQSQVPATGAFVERETPRHLVLRGQGGEEIVFAAVPVEGGAGVRGSSLLFGQQVKRFFSTLPPAPDARGAA